MSRTAKWSVLVALGGGLLVVAFLVVVMVRGRLHPLQIGVELELPVSKSVALSDGPCTSGSSLHLRSVAVLGSSKVGTVHAPLCYHLVGLGAPKCVLEFETESPVAYSPASLVSGLAGVYYTATRGGFLYFESADFESTETKHSYVMLDGRWCAWLGAANGLNVRG